MSTNMDTILAIDLRRYKSVACVYQRSSREHAFCTIDTRPSELTKLLARYPQAPVVIETCANAGWVHDHAAAASSLVGCTGRNRRNATSPPIAPATNSHDADTQMIRQSSRRS